MLRSDLLWGEAGIEGIFPLQWVFPHKNEVITFPIFSNFTNGIVLKIIVCETKVISLQTLFIYAYNLRLRPY